jgi:aerobic-type carbon monoxide dehydrogenase small subunit (CoxS/CutS family)
MPEPRPEPPRGAVTRRTFFRTAGLAAVAGALYKEVPAVAQDEAPSGPAVRTQGPGPVAITLSANGEKRKIEVEPRRTLLEALRTDLDLTGAKDVCDRGTCGACTVWFDGAPVYACTILAVEAEGHEVTTVEGLGTPDRMHPVQAAFVQADALQCGFCTPGLVMSAAWAVKTHGKGLTMAQAKEACAGNLCRCGTYNHVLDAALAAAKGKV